MKKLKSDVDLFVVAAYVAVFVAGLYVLSLVFPALYEGLKFLATLAVGGVLIPLFVRRFLGVKS